MGTQTLSLSMSTERGVWGYCSWILIWWDHEPGLRTKEGRGSMFRRSRVAKVAFASFSPFCDGIYIKMPGARLVRIALYMYGYRNVRLDMTCRRDHVAMVRVVVGIRRIIISSSCFLSPPLFLSSSVSMHLIHGSPRPKIRREQYHQIYSTPPKSKDVSVTSLLHIKPRVE